MKRVVYSIVLAALVGMLFPQVTLAAGISVSGGGNKYSDETASVTITASGASFNAFSGTISSSGSLRITSCSANKAIWSREPSGTGDFAGALTSNTTSFRIATCTVKATGVGTGRVSVSNVVLTNPEKAKTRENVGTDGGSASFTFTRRPTPPGTITVTSTSHPDQATAYEATSVAIAWDKPSGVTGFSYIYDQIADTTPATKVVSADTSISYEDQAIGIYYFHIRALNGDGWGPTTHFKVNIKEPDPRVNESLAKPSQIVLKKLSTYENNIENGTFSGFSVSGVTEPNFMANIVLNPVPTLPDGKILSVKADETGKFEYTFDFPIKAGLYILTVQGQDNKILTPLSDPIKFEISQAKGGSINILSNSDVREPIIPVKKWYQKVNYTILSIVLLVLFLISIGLMIFMGIKGRGFKGLMKDLKHIDIR